MKQRALFIISSFIFHVVVFLILKATFTIIHSPIGGGVSVADFANVLWHGLGLDMSTSGYLTAIPALLTIVSIWIKPKNIARILTAYWAVISCILIAIFVVDIALYPYWGYHFDSTIFLYLQNPADALASAPAWQMILGFAVFIGLSFALFYIIKKVLIKQVLFFAKINGNKSIVPAIAITILTASLFLPIRGSITVSTMNVGTAYFSDNMYLNHAAVNPHFNLLYSATKSERFEKQYQFYDRANAENTFTQLITHNTDSIIQLLNTKKPNIILCVLESFSAFAAYDSVIAPNFCRMAKEGINFSNFYANSFRTDRGLVSILSGYPAHPTAALMKYPMKTQSLPSIPKALVKEGYQSAFYYGGDIDFASMRSYIVGACATEDVYEDSDFSDNRYAAKWGAPDEFVLKRVMDDINKGSYKEPFIATLLTLSSHEPFDVPMEKTLEDEFYHSMNYTDRELGIFIENLKASDYWHNTIVILLADHCMQTYPIGKSNHQQEKYHIPMLWIGGAIKAPKEIREFGSQNNLASTLLGQLDIDYSDFLFSGNMLSYKEPKFAFYSYNNGFSMRDTTGVYTYDNTGNQVLVQEGEYLEEKAKSFFQMMYLDLGER